MEKLDINTKQNVTYCIPDELRDEQIKINCAKVSGRVQGAIQLTGEPIALVGFAPSLQQTWEQIRNFKVVMTCSGAHKFLVERGIIPTYHLDLDPRPHKVTMLGTPQKETEYLIASTVHPNYLDALNGYNVKLWHIFANEEEAARVLPRGEWMLAGGSSVGSRCMTMARFLGYTNLHIFGMDGSMTEKDSHTTEHPNRPKKAFETEYEGVKYLTTPSMLHVAKETFSELDQMADVTATFYGEGLIQHMARNYVPKKQRSTNIAFNKPELISDEYRRLNWELHQSHPTYGMGGGKHAQVVQQLSEQLKTTSILDFGCGKGMLAKALPFPIWEYDPAIPEKSAYPKSADIVVCTDVLEHIEPDKINIVLDELRRLTKQVGYFVVSTRQAVKTYSNGQNTHLIVKDKKWWEAKLAKFFTIGTVIEKEKEYELHIMVSPKTSPQEATMTIEGIGVKAQFYTPNDTTIWRAQTLFTKEPSTIDWLQTIKAGDVVYDIGANVGSYTILAGLKGAEVYAFEPEAQNYALLVRNMQLNGIKPNAYCVALSDEEKAGTLFAGQQGAGGACHSFNEEVGFDLRFRESPFTQGSFGIPLDTLIERGLPSPKHIKIDVDGFEFKVIKGAQKVLANGVQSILVEVNPSIPQHKEMIDLLMSLGFSYDHAQVQRAERKEGTFKGCAEYIFRKRSPIEQHLFDKLRNAKVIEKPFPHLYVEGIFPEKVYDELVNGFPEKYESIEKTRGAHGYPLRSTAPLDSPLWQSVKEALTEGVIRETLCRKLGAGDPARLMQDVLLVRDMEGYQISPHTDIPQKVVTALFYLPKDNSIEQEGTVIYKPKKKGFTCKTGKHYSFGEFKKVKTMPFKPNSLFAFLRTDNSFHGVKPSGHVRDVLLYNLKTNG
jgi:FkbM family methyltransferase